MAKYTQFCYAATLCIAFCYALDEESAKERRCFKVDTAQDLSYRWLQTVSKWYFPIWHKLELYRTASDITGDPISDIPDELLDAACAVTDPQFVIDGFNRTQVKYEINFNTDWSIGFISTVSKYAKRGSHYLAMTNNVDLVVGITCWEDDEISYGVWSTWPGISEENKQLVWEFLEKLGFDKEYLVETPYDGCRASENVKNDKQEL